MQPDHCLAERELEAYPALHFSQPSICQVSTRTRLSDSGGRREDGAPCEDAARSLGFYANPFTAAAASISLRRHRRMRSVAMGRGPSRVQPLAVSWPPPPNRSAMLATLTRPLLRRLR